MKIETTLAKLCKAEACKPRYRHLVKSLGGIERYGRDTPISMLQILRSNGLADAIWALKCCDIDGAGTIALRLFVSDCAERKLLRERSAGRSWAAVETSRRYAADAAREAAQIAADAAMCAAQNTQDAVAAAQNAAISAIVSATINATLDTRDTRAAEIEWQTQRLIELLTEREE